MTTSFSQYMILNSELGDWYSSAACLNDNSLSTILYTCLKISEVQVLNFRDQAEQDCGMSRVKLDE